ncbi:MAG: hypothetical protein HN919_15955 [Verrucomicrobia bacterium]|jgi:hypothetical protein|nr:hypothetical protein [Verrucomicrobiota bacterium]MBT7067793.1 hypothetical protein [Verrucomicrobiota bacterium]MBT7701036.1 hypothetical protein [Verrucomicrobiota bacterium]
MLSDMVASLAACTERLADVKADALDAATLKRFVNELKKHLEAWHKEAYGYDPELTWWIETPYEQAKEALEAYIKSLHREPGDQPYVAKEIADEAIAFLEEHELVTLPEHAKKIWRQVMISPELQKGSNCVPFLKATVHHELIPGHHLMMYMNDRFNTHRKGYGTPFLGDEK